jgi:uncharacterized protein
MHLRPKHLVLWAIAFLLIADSLFEQGIYKYCDALGPENQITETIFLYRYNSLDVLAMMMPGIAFLNNGILKAAKSKGYCLVMGLIGYRIGVTTNYFEGSQIIRSNFAIIAFYKSFITYNLGRAATIMGHIALIMLFIKSCWLKFLQKSLAAVWQMAFPNYIMHSIICNIIFLGYGLAMFGKFLRYELFYVVISIWIFQLILSPVLLSYFRFGPLEWAWRSLTYCKMQPLRKE